MRTAVAFTLSLVTLFFLAPAPAQAQDLGVQSFGVRGGLTIDPDQAHLGVHLDAGEFAPYVRFQPSFELGFGSDRTVAAINIDALYTFDPRPWRPYLGAGLGIAIIDRDTRRGDGDSDVNTEAGLNLIAGFEWGDLHRYMLEARAGIGDIPDFKVTIGINF